MAQELRRSLSNSERRMYRRTVKDFGSEIICFDEGLNVLASCVLIRVQNEPLLSSTDAIEHLKKADDSTRSWGVWTLLVNHARLLLEATSLLLLTGHQNRALSCARDAFEALQWADICLNNSQQARRWLDNKKPKTNGVTYNSHLSKDTGDMAQRVLSTSGTHPYLDACVRSLNARAVVASRRPKKEAVEAYKRSTLFSLYACLLVTKTAIEYVVHSDTALAQSVSGAAGVVGRIYSTLNALYSSIQATSVP